MRIPRHIYVGVPENHPAPASAGGPTPPAQPQPPAGGPPVANMAYVGLEQGWLFGPAMGAWLRNFAWWVIPVGALLLFGGWYMALVCRSAVIATPPPASPPAAVNPVPTVPASPNPAPAATLPAPTLAPAVQGTPALTPKPPMIIKVQSLPVPVLTPQAIEQAAKQLAGAMRNSALPASSAEPQPTTLPLTSGENPCAGLASREYRRCRIWFQLP